MRLLRVNGNRLVCTKDLIKEHPPYAILSHTWGEEDDEVTFNDIVAGQGSHKLGWEPWFRKSRWFTRGWTLQELLAPEKVEFFSSEGAHLGSKESLESKIHKITQTPVDALRGRQLSEFSMDKRMSWSEGRFTTYPEDKAYSLLGIFSVYIPLIYGEGQDNAFARLRRAISEQDHHPNETRDRLLGWLPYLDEQRFYTESRSARKSGATTGNWFINRHMGAWMHENSLLWLHGKAGSGKTVMISKVIEYLEGSNARLLAYYYFTFQSKDSQTLRNLKSALLIQILKKLYLPHPENSDVFFIPQAFQDLYDAHFPSRTPPMEDLDSLLIKMIDLSKNTFLVIDALDECDSQLVRVQVLDFLAKLLKNVETNPHIIVTSRLEVGIETKISYLSIPTIPVALQATDVDRDIRKHLKVIQHLIQNAGGVFRWADLQVQGLRGKSREVNVNRALKRLPRYLGETYGHNLQRIELENYRLEAMVVLRWLACSARPLNIAEIAELAIFDVEESDEANLPPSSKDTAADVLHILSGARHKHTIKQQRTPTSICHCLIFSFLSIGKISSSSLFCFSVWGHTQEPEVFNAIDNYGEHLLASFITRYVQEYDYAISLISEDVSEFIGGFVDQGAQSLQTSSQIHLAITLADYNLIYLLLDCSLAVLEDILLSASLKCNPKNNTRISTEIIKEVITQS
ncbi:hypothetical protein V8C42DRAFT_363918 [Trichoderma barbatum]